jgi:hypothetical protein
VAGKGVGGWIWCKQCIHMYINAKLIPVETVPGNQGTGNGENSGVGWNSNMIYLIHYRNLCKWYNAPTPSTTIKTKKKVKGANLWGREPAAWGKGIRTGDGVNVIKVVCILLWKWHIDIHHFLQLIHTNKIYLLY